MDAPPAGSNLVQVMKSFTHPLRIRMFYALTARGGSATATQLAKDVGTTAQLAYYHLSIMAKLGVLEADLAARARGRERFWKHSTEGLSFDPADLGPGSESGIELLHRAQVAAHFELLQRFFSREVTEGDDFRTAAFGSDMVLKLSLAQFADLQQELTDVLLRFRDQTAQQPSEDAETQQVFALLHAFPIS